MSNVWLITGSFRGLGRALTEVVLEAGQRVVASARQPEQLCDLRATDKNRLLTATPLCIVVCQNR
jgi:NAD(P)-dependent dehydrogenase (short-subunit alcohol dehydrogenase family)